MQRFRILLLCGAVLSSISPAHAADALKFGAAPGWVIPQAIPSASKADEDQPLALLLSDQQIKMMPGKVLTYSQVAMKIQKPEGLAAGNISIPWNPASDTVTVNRLEIHRGDKVIDVLATQQFTTIRREAGLEAAMIDGVLTANIQPEGLQQGDTIVLVTTTEHADPVLGRHVEANFANWLGLPVDAAHVRLDWPASMKLKIQTRGIDAPQPVTRDDRKIVEITARNVQPIIAPKEAPLRFALGRFGEASDFESWNDVAALMLPLYAKASAIPASGPLHDEVEKIRTSTTDPKMRALQALQMVQDRVRYVALLIGQGGYVPADAETTWSRRFGDCKAKTALLLGLLHSLGIEAEPVLVQSRIGDAIAERLPMISYFDHVLVRARASGKIYYLDGTRTGDTDLDDIVVPNVGWALPIVPEAKLVHLLPPPFTSPQEETRADIDASKGIYTPAPARIEQIVHGDSAVAMKSQLDALSDAQRREFFQAYWKKQFEFITYRSSTTRFDKAKRELHLSLAGDAKLDWSTGFFHVPNSTVGYDPDFDRPPGPNRDVPFAVAYPDYSHSLVHLHLPASFTSDRPKGAVDVDETLAGIEYKRTSRLEGTVLTVEVSERSVVPEVAAKDARLAAPRLKALAEEDIALPLTSKYSPTPDDLTALAAAEPGSAKEYLRRGLAFMQAKQFDKAIADFTRAHELDPSEIWSLANRAISYALQNKTELAQKDLEQVQSKEPDNAVALRARGFIAEQKREWAKAIDFYSKSLASDPGNAFALGHRAQSETMMSKTDEALADSAQALKADPSWGELRVLRANILVGRGTPDDVAREAQLLISENPNSAYAYVAAGKIYAHLRRTAEAMKAFDHALAIEPDAFVYLNRAQARPLSDASGRRADLAAALKLDPTNADVLAEEAEQLAAGKDFKGARLLYEQVLKTAPDNRRLQMRRAALLFRAGDTAEATKLFAKLRAEARSAVEFNSLCWQKATDGILLETALEECREALKAMPENGSFHDSLALVELRLGYLDAAIADYNQSIAQKVHSSYMGRAIAYARKGDKVHAAADLAEALKYDPDAKTRFEEYGLRFEQAAAEGEPKPAPHAGASH